MSLFPAYSAGTSEEKVTTTVTDEVKEQVDWLENSSFQSEIAEKRGKFLESSVNFYPSSPEVVEIVEETIRELPAKEDKRRKKKRKHRETREKAQSYDTQVSNVYFEDKSGDKMDRRCPILYDIYRGTGSFPRAKREKTPRYHAKLVDSSKQSKKKKESERKTAESLEIAMDEGEMDKTREFNQKLAESPDDIDLWISYVNHQDATIKHQGSRSGVSRDNLRTVVQKKLSIVGKALESNSRSKRLLRLKLRLMSELLPADQFSSEIEDLLSKDQENMIMWQFFITNSQKSVALCHVPKILNLYARFFTFISKRNRSNPQLYDKRILEMLLRCLTFLRHAGLWEQMWETIGINLALNLEINKSNLNSQKAIDEKELIGMEEVILTSQLPLNQLWLRVESLRERCHWISVSREQLELVGDSNRFILPEDVTDFAYPLLTKASNFQLGIYCLLSLKVPLLPTRDCLLRDLSLKHLDWFLDSAEFLLPFAYPFVDEVTSIKCGEEFLVGILDGKLTSGPQCLRFHPTRDPFLNFVRDAFSKIADSLPENGRTCIYVWWLRFERALIYINRTDPVMPDNKGKKLKSMLKEFLKRVENRNNVYFYREYALIEREIGKLESCTSILETTISSTSIQDPIAFFHLYRTLIECLLGAENLPDKKQRILSVFSNLISHQKSPSVEECLKNFVKESFGNLPEQSEDLNLEEQFFPCVQCDSLACLAYFLYVNERDLDEIVNTYDTALKLSENNCYVYERLSESKLTFLKMYSGPTSKFRELINKTTSETLSRFPANFMALSTYAAVQCETPFWKISVKRNEIGLWESLAMCLSGRVRINRLREIGLMANAEAALNKLLSLHKVLAKRAETQNCPLIWRLYMLLLRENNLSGKKGEEVYYESVDNCPWARCVYIDAAEIAPQILTQIQDVIREKELRMHVTPEELDILRG